jgi:hypothetical protein
LPRDYSVKWAQRRRKKEIGAPAKVEISIGGRETAGGIVLSELNGDGKFGKDANASVARTVVES